MTVALDQAPKTGTREAFSVYQLSQLKKKKSACHCLNPLIFLSRKPKPLLWPKSSHIWSALSPSFLLSNHSSAQPHWLLCSVPLKLNDLPTSSLCIYCLLTPMWYPPSLPLGIYSKKPSLTALFEIATASNFFCPVVLFLALVSPDFSSFNCFLI